MDNEFGVLADKIMMIPVNIVGVGEHLGDIKQSNRTIKERTRSHMHMLPYKVYPIEMVCGCITKVTKDLTFEVADNGLLGLLSQITIITRIGNLNYKEFQSLNFRDYVQTHVPATKTNTNESRTTGAITIYHPRNKQCSWYFMSLNTDKRIYRHTWDIIPIRNDVINRVNTIRKIDVQPIVASNFRFH